MSYDSKVCVPAAALPKVSSCVQLPPPLEEISRKIGWADVKLTVPSVLRSKLSVAVLAPLRSACREMEFTAGGLPVAPIRKAGPVGRPSVRFVTT